MYYKDTSENKKMKIKKRESKSVKYSLKTLQNYEVSHDCLVLLY